MEKVYIYHSKSASNRVTVAGEFSEDGRTITLAASRCSDRDQFTRKSGRIKATGKLKSKKSVTIVVDPDQDRAGTFVDLAATICQYVSVKITTDLNVYDLSRSVRV